MQGAKVVTTEVTEIDIERDDYSWILHTACKATQDTQPRTHRKRQAGAEERFGKCEGPSSNPQHPC